MVQFILICLILLGYFLYMTSEDIKSMTVPVIPGNIFIMTFMGNYFANCLYFGAFPDIIPLFIGTMILIIFCRRRLFMGSGDAKALYICFLASPYINLTGEWSGMLNAFIPCMIWLFAAVPFVGYCFISGIRKKLPIRQIMSGRGQKTAFFPFLTIGFLFYIILVFVGKYF